MEEIAATLLAYARNEKLGQPASFSIDETTRIQKAISDAVKLLMSLSHAIDATSKASEQQKTSIRYSAVPLPK